MKSKSLILWMLAFLLSANLFSQETYALKISDIRIQQKKDITSAETIIEGILTQNVPQAFTLYEQDNLKVWVEFTAKFKGRRMKLVRNIYVEAPDGSVKIFKQKKAVQMLKVSVTGSMKGRDTAEILYNRKMRKSIFVKYNYDLTY